MFLISAPWRDEDIHSTTYKAAYEKRPYVPLSFSSVFHCIICFTNWAKSPDKFLSFKFIKFVEFNKWIHLLYRIPVFVVLLKSMKMNIKNRRLSMLWKHMEHISNTDHECCSKSLIFLRVFLSAFLIAWEFYILYTVFESNSLHISYLKLFPYHILSQLHVFSIFELTETSESSV